MNDDLENTLRDSLDRHAAGAPAWTGSVDDVYRRADRRRARRRSIAVVGSIAVIAVGIVGFASLGGGSDPAPDLAAASADQPAGTAPDVNVYACTNYLGSKDEGAYGQREIYGDCVPVTWDGPVSATINATPECIVPTTIPITTIPTTTSGTGTGTGAGVANATAEATMCLDPTTGLPPGLPPGCVTAIPTTTTTPGTGGAGASIEITCGYPAPGLSGCVETNSPTTSIVVPASGQPAEAGGCTNSPPVYVQQCFANIPTTIPAIATTTTSPDVAIGTVPDPGNAAAGTVVCESSSSQASTTTTTVP